MTRKEETPEQIYKDQSYVWLRTYESVDLASEILVSFRVFRGQMARSGFVKSVYSFKTDLIKVPDDF